MPAFVLLYVGDAIWALLVFWLTCFVKPDWPLLYRGGTALLFAFLIEFSQLYQADWINNIRYTRLGGLILGFSFLPSDLVAYTAGVVTGIFLDQRLFKQLLTNSKEN